MNNLMKSYQSWKSFILIDLEIDLSILVYNDLTGLFSTSKMWYKVILKAEIVTSYTKSQVISTKNS